MLKKCPEGLTRFFNWYMDFFLVFLIENSICNIKYSISKRSKWMVFAPFQNNLLKGELNNVF